MKLGFKKNLILKDEIKYIYIKMTPKNTRVIRPNLLSKSWDRDNLVKKIKKNNEAYFFKINVE
jgi:ribosomal protein S6